MIILRKQTSNSESLEQREFARWTRPFKKAIGRLRRGIASKLENDILKRQNKKELGTIPPVNPDASQRIEEKLDKYGIKVVNADLGKKSPYSIRSTKDKFAHQELYHGEHQQVKDAILDPEVKGVAVLDPKSKNVASEVHEGGHGINKQGNNPVKKFISNLDTPTRRARFQKSQESPDRGNLKGAYQNLVDGAIIKAEEKNATNNGKKLLKDSGLTKEEKKRVSKYLKEAGNSYTDQLKNNLEDNLRTMIQIPSRKHLKSTDTVFEEVKNKKLVEMTKGKVKPRYKYSKDYGRNRKKFHEKLKVKIIKSNRPREEFNPWKGGWVKDSVYLITSPGNDEGEEVIGEGYVLHTTFEVFGGEKIVDVLSSPSQYIRGYHVVDRKGWWIFKKEITEPYYYPILTFTLPDKSLKVGLLEKYFNQEEEGKWVLKDKYIPKVHYTEGFSSFINDYLYCLNLLDWADLDYWAEETLKQLLKDEKV